LPNISLFKILSNLNVFTTAFQEILKILSKTLNNL